MYGLVLNRMTHAAEEGTLVAVAETIERLIAFHQEHLVVPYEDGVWHKTYRVGSPLEWYNPPQSFVPDSNPMRQDIVTVPGRADFLWKQSEVWDEQKRDFIRQQTEFWDTEIGSKILRSDL